ncbi:sensor histidine kinase [Ruminiclostridium cellobioparum]|uniref:histidine kinase n=1 Tax=Ruminiclostridium cellobioparum subsp. termitidis CT1112 TaxID=1195236 RepID=S0FQK1_RUMCE|nr:HAMP domain-containing sensor histidine kinase [Ruminiclostridium cellobioparum]EMS72646.1 His Kinase A (phosphoacceptor) domain/Histidine kinase-, DNA gyrase B-, and HSP90-like ATPase [Ruminiclostridium cellobioparum subsp. termitidis CT1112]
MKLSIQLKILIAFSVIIFIGLSALLFVSYKLTEQNDNSIINADMIATKKNLDQYLKQYFLINHLDFTGASLISQAEDISVQLSFAIGSDVDIYNMNGNEMSHNPEPGYISMKNEDLINAMKGKISYATVTNENGTKVSLSYPIQVNNANIGIIRYTKDNVTHELKTPITVITGYAQAMKENGFSDRNMYDKAVFYISDESRRLNNMVVELLELSEVSSTNFKYFFENADIGELVRQTCEEMQIKAKKYNIDIRSNVPENLFLICDRDRLKGVLINLIDNSIKYGNVNSSIEVRAYREGKKVFIRVKDEGEGISEDNMEKLFEPFFRVSKKVSRESGSAGLGLTIVKNIVEKHGGVVEVQSKLKEGTEVIIRLEDDFLC